MAEDKVTAGHVEIELGGQKYTLVPSLGAALTVNKLFKGFLNVDQRLREFDLEAIILVLQAGLGDKAPDNLGEKVFAEGIFTTRNPVLEFVSILANGGKKYDATEKASEGNG